MSEAFQLTHFALDDLEMIVAHIAQDNLDAAIRVESAIIMACRRLSRNPLIGSKHADVTPLPVRFWPVSQFPNYIIVYLPESRPLQVVAILHGMRDIPAILPGRQPS